MSPELRRNVAQMMRRALGLELEADALPVRWRSWRWICQLPTHVVFVAPDEAAWHRLETEREVIGRVGGLAGSVAHYEYPVHVRPFIDGITGFAIERLAFGGMPTVAQRYAADGPLTEPGRRLAQEFGAAMARFHATPTDGLELPTELEDLDFDEVASVLAAAPDTAELRRACEECRRWYEDLPAEDILIHGDLHLHNIVAGPQGDLRGLLDLESVCASRRAADLRYWPSTGIPFTGAALDAYCAVSGVTIDPSTVWRFHVLGALDHFNFVPRDATRFTEIVAWAKAAVCHLVPEWR